MDDAAVNEITKKLEECNINVSDISLEVRSFILIYYCLTICTFLSGFLEEGAKGRSASSAQTN